MGETPLLPIISSYLKQATEEIENLQTDFSSIQLMLEQTTAPIVFVEGESDKIIFEKCWELFGTPDLSLNIQSCSGTTKMKSLSQDGHVLQSLTPIQEMEPGKKTFRPQALALMDHHLPKV